jgi:hypothetical protein
MKQNVGGPDRMLRIVIGLALIGWGLSTQNWIGAIGIVPLATGILRWCPAYCPLGISTSGKSCCGGTCDKK